MFTIFIGAFTKNPLTSPTSFLLFNDSIFVQNTNFYFNWFEGILDWYKKTHDYELPFTKFILFLVPFSAFYYAYLLYYIYSREEKSFSLVYEHTVFKFKPFWMQWSYYYPREPFLIGLCRSSSFYLK